MTVRPFFFYVETAINHRTPALSVGGGIDGREEKFQSKCVDVLTFVVVVSRIVFHVASCRQNNTTDGSFNSC